MWTRNVVWVAAVVALVGACGGEDEDSGNNPGGTGGSGGGAAGMMAATGGMTATGGTSGAGGSGGVVGGMGGSGGFMLPECSMEPGPSMCGTNACTAVMPGAICNKTCCTADNKCGLTSSINPMCIEAIDAQMCQPATILGQMTPACCVPGTNTCGVVNTLTGDPPCVARAMVPLANLPPANCDGTPVMMTTGGTGGMGTGGMGTGGMEETGGMGAADAGL